MNENITPLPWKNPQAIGGGLRILGADGHTVCLIEFGKQEGSQPVIKSKALRNAAYIVEACNAYPALTARVKELEEALGDCVGMLRGFTSSEHDEEGAVTQQIKDADAALNKEPTHESRCTCNDAPPIHKISGESFDDEAMRHYENLDQYREHRPLHGRFVNKEPTT